MKMRLAVSMVLAVVAVACGGTQQETPEPQQSTEQGIQLPSGGEQCGNTVCGKGTYCCNPSCSLCVAMDQVCLDVVCDVAVDESAKAPEAAIIGESCGGAVCGKGTYCCNASCGICAPTGMSCTQQACDNGI